jgi:hypothetical protein
VYISDFIFFDREALLKHDGFLREKKTNLFNTLEEENGLLKWYKMAAHSISNLNFENVSLVIGEALDPSFRSPTFSQWLLSFLGWQIPAFDFVTGGTILSFVGMYKPQFDNFLYVGLGVIEREHDFESGLVAIRFNSSEGCVKIVDGEILYTEKILRFNNHCFEDCELTYSAPSAKTLSLLKELVDTEHSIYPWFIRNCPRYKPFIINDSAIQLLRTAKDFVSGTKLKVIEVGLNGALGVTTVEIC